MVALFNKLDITALIGIIYGWNFKFICNARKVSAVSAYHIDKTTYMSDN